MYTINRPIIIFIIISFLVLSCDKAKNMSQLHENSILGIAIDTCSQLDSKIDLISFNLNGYDSLYNERKIVKLNFDSVYPYSDIRLCNIYKNGEIIYASSNQFSRDSNTFVEIPQFYTKTFLKKNRFYCLISKVKRKGFILNKSFINNGLEIKYIYIGAYEASLRNNTLYSCTNSLPLTNKSLSEFKGLLDKKNQRFSLIDFEALSTLQLLFLIEMQNKNSQLVLGPGIVNLDQPIIRNNDIQIKNYFEIDYDPVFAAQRYWIGMNICFITKKNSIIIRKCINIDYSSNITKIYFDGEKINFSDIESFGAFAQNTGYTDFIKESTKNVKIHEKSDVDYISAIKYRDIENLWGNVWEYVDGIYISNLTPYLKSINSSSTYNALNYKIPPQKNLGLHNDTFGYINDVMLDSNLYFLPKSLGKSNSKNSFGDFYYAHENGNYNLVFGGGWDHYDRAGLFCFRFWIYNNTSWYLYGTRLMYK